MKDLRDILGGRLAMNSYKKIITITALILSSVSFAAAGEDHDCRQCQSVIGASIHGSTGRWLEQDVPHRNWQCIEVEDLGSPSQTCEMCEVETIRYVHRMQHNNYADLEVGCICAGHMEGNMDNANVRDRELKSQAQRRDNWLYLQWRTSKKGNLYINTRPNNTDNMSHNVAIVSGQYGQMAGLFTACVDKYRLKRWFPTIAQAQLAAFDYLWPARRNIY